MWQVTPALAILNPPLCWPPMPPTWRLRSKPLNKSPGSRVGSRAVSSLGHPSDDTADTPWSKECDRTEENGTVWSNHIKYHMSIFRRQDTTSTVNGFVVPKRASCTYPIQGVVEEIAT